MKYIVIIFAFVGVLPLLKFCERLARSFHDRVERLILRYTRNFELNKWQKKLLNAAWRMTTSYAHDRKLRSWQYAPLVYGISKFDLDVRKGQFRKFDIKEIDDGFYLFLLNKAGLIDNVEIISLMPKYMDIVRSRICDDGSLKYRAGSNVAFVDALPFACPLLMKLGVLSHNDELKELSIKILKTFVKYGVDERTGLVYHGYRIDNHLPCESVGWGRGMAWYSIALILTYEASDDANNREWLLGTMTHVARLLCKCQAKDGGWCTKIVRGRIFDSSATSIITLFLLKLNEINGNCWYEASCQGIKKLMEVTDWRGRVMFSEGECVDIGSYSNIYKPAALTQGFALWCAYLMTKQTGQGKDKMI